MRYNNLNFSRSRKYGILLWSHVAIPMSQHLLDFLMVRKARDMFVKMSAYGITSLFAWQKSAVNSGWNRCIVATQVQVTISPLYRKVYCLFVSSIEGLPQIPTTMSSSTTQMNRMLTNVKKHPLYYHDNMDLTIIVGFHSDCCWTWVLIWILKVADTCFCQPSYFFTRESPVFRDRLAGHTSKNDAMNCTKHDSAKSDVSVKHTIVIEPHENVSPDDFAELCSIFDNPYAAANISFCLRLMSRQEVYKL